MNVFGIAFIVLGKTFVIVINIVILTYFGGRIQSIHLYTTTKTISVDLSARSMYVR